MRTWAAVGLAAVVLASLAACGSEQAGTAPEEGGNVDVAPTPGPERPPIAEPVGPGDSIAAMFGWPHSSEVALAYCPDPEADHLRDDLAVTEVYICTTEQRAVTGEGTWAFAVVRRVTGGADALLDAYAVADEEPTDGMCTMELPDPRIVWVHADTISTVRAPQDGCGKPMPEAIAAYDAVTTATVAEERLDQITSALADESGCAQEWTDMIRYFVDYPDDQSQWEVTDLPFDPDRACTYAVDPQEPADKAQGQLVAGALLSAPQQAAIRTALADSVADPACARTGHTRFVVLWSDGSDHAVYVALDGCAVQRDSSWWRATDALRTLLA